MRSITYNMLLTTAAMALSLLAPLPVAHAAEDMPSIAPAVQQFTRTYCFDCHGADQENATLRFDTLSHAIGDEALAQS